MLCYSGAPTKPASPESIITKDEAADAQMKIVTTVDMNSGLRAELVIEPPLRAGPVGSAPE